MQRTKSQSLTYDLIRGLAPYPWDKRLIYTLSHLHPTLAPNESLRKRLSYAAAGFKSQSIILYDLDPYDLDDYLSDLDRHTKSGNINNSKASVLKDKKETHKFFKNHGFGRYLPQYYGDLNKGTVTNVDKRFLHLLHQCGKLVTKPARGSEGTDVNIYKWDGEKYTANGEEISETEVERRAISCNGHLVEEYCEQADYAESLYPHTTNTIRILTMKPEDSEAFVPIAIHRIGTKKTNGVDNFAKGGMSARICDDGTLTEAAHYNNNSLTWRDRHIDTGNKIKDVTVPSWTKIRDVVLSILDEIEGFRYIAWDIILTEDGDIKILEANNRSGVLSLQVHKPLMTDPRVKQFYKDHGIC